jgi:hypothetical protein
LKRKGVELFAHLAFQCVNDEAVLLHTGFAAKALRHNIGSVVVAISCQITNGHVSVG